MNLNTFIHEMYTAAPYYIETDFTLLQENDMVACGKTFIDKESDIIILDGNLKDINLNRLFNKPDTNIIHLDANDFPKYFRCELKNFPKFNRISNLVGKNIIINIPKVMINGDLSFGMYSNYSQYKCKMTPLYNANKLFDFILEQN